MNDLLVIILTLASINFVLINGQSLQGSTEIPCEEKDNQLINPTEILDMGESIGECIECRCRSNRIVCDFSSLECTRDPPTILNQKTGRYEDSLKSRMLRNEQYEEEESTSITGFKKTDGASTLASKILSSTTTTPAPTTTELSQDELDHQAAEFIRAQEGIDKLTYVRDLLGDDGAVEWYRTSKKPPGVPDNISFDDNKEDDEVVPAWDQPEEKEKDKEETPQEPKISNRLAVKTTPMPNEIEDSEPDQIQESDLAAKNSFTISRFKPVRVRASISDEIDKYAYLGPTVQFADWSAIFTILVIIFCALAVYGFAVIIKVMIYSGLEILSSKKDTQASEPRIDDEQIFKITPSNRSHAFPGSAGFSIGPMRTNLNANFNV